MFQSRARCEVAACERTRNAEFSVLRRVNAGGSYVDGREWLRARLVGKPIFEDARWGLFPLDHLASMNFFSIDRHILRRLNTESDVIAFYTKYGDPDRFPDHDTLPDPAGKNQHSLRVPLYAV